MKAQELISKGYEKIKKKHWLSIYLRIMKHHECPYAAICEYDPSVKNHKTKFLLLGELLGDDWEPVKS